MKKKSEAELRAQNAALKKHVKRLEDKLSLTDLYKTTAEKYLDENAAIRAESERLKEENEKLLTRNVLLKSDNEWLEGIRTQILNFCARNNHKFPLNWKRNPEENIEE